MFYRLRAASPGWSHPLDPVTGMAGLQMGKRWLTARSATATMISTRFRSQAARRSAPDRRARPRRWARLLARWPLYLLQISSNGDHADLADEARWNRPGTRDRGRLCQLFSASFSGRKWLVMLSYDKVLKGILPTRTWLCGSCLSQAERRGS